MNMNWQGLKKGIAGATLAVTLLLGGGAILGTTAQAQNRDRDWRRDDRRDNNRRDNNRDWNRDGRRDNDRRDNNRDWERRRAEERARAIQRARELEWRRQQELSRRRNNGYGYGYPRNYPNGGGYYGGYRNGGSYNSYDEQKGFRDGLDRGQEDLRDRRRADPNNSDHYRSGNAAYREGFRRGYAQGYRSYGRW